MIFNALAPLEEEDFSSKERSTLPTELPPLFLSMDFDDFRLWNVFNFYKPTDFPIRPK
mgnify:FL=1